VGADDCFRNCFVWQNHRVFVFFSAAINQRHVATSGARVEFREAPLGRACFVPRARLKVISESPSTLWLLALSPFVARARA
jgi:hypothetical protein